MPVIISMLRGINLGGHRQIQMGELRALYESLNLRDAQTFINSGNVLFRTESRDLRLLARKIESAIEKRFGFHCDVILRSASDLREVIARNPFAARRGIEPSKLLVTFLAGDPEPEARDRVLGIDASPEEL